MKCIVKLKADKAVGTDSIMTKHVNTVIQCVYQKQIEVCVIKILLGTVVSYTNHVW